MYRINKFQFKEGIFCSMWLPDPSAEPEGKWIFTTACKVSCARIVKRMIPPRSTPGARKRYGLGEKMRYGALFSCLE